MERFHFTLVLVWSLFFSKVHYSDGRRFRPTRDATVTIAVIGRNDTEISSTIKELIGPEFNCSQTENEGTFPNILEYTIDGTHYYGQYTLKILQVPAFEDFQSSENVSTILASLKSYIQSQCPIDFYLILSRFDEYPSPENSDFMIFWKKMEFFQKVFLQDIINTNGEKSQMVSHFTNLISEIVSEDEQKQPESKITDFREIIEKFTDLQPPQHILVGENREIENGLLKQNGYYILPNRQNYPTNVWQDLISLSKTTTVANLLTWMMEHRERKIECEANRISTEWENYLDDAHAISYLLTLQNTSVDRNQVNSKIDIVSKNPKYLAQKIALQLYLQQNNITEIAQLPKQLVDIGQGYLFKEAFKVIVPKYLQSLNYFQEQDKELKDFRKREILGPDTVIPEYIPRPFTVGYGYDILADNFSLRSPFRTDILEMDFEIGYQLPNFMNCKKLVKPEAKEFKSLSANMSEYFNERMKYLHFPGKENFTEENFRGNVKEGFNVQPKSLKISSVILETSQTEVRLMSCDLVMNESSWVIDPEFSRDVESLVEFDSNNIKVVNHWNSWFGKWGSHIVVQGYGGGALIGTKIGVMNIFQGFYRQYGGESDPRIKLLDHWTEGRKKLTIGKWKDSLDVYFRMLTTELRVEPISMVVKKKFGVKKGKMVENAVQLLMNGRLKYRKGEKGKKRECTGWNNINPICHLSIWLNL